MVNSEELIRVHAAAGLALVRSEASGATRWLPWPPSATGQRSERDPSIALEAAAFAPETHFVVTASADGHAPQNALVLLHGRGGDETPFAQLGARMELPQTVALPFDLGHTWLDDLDEHFDVIPPDTPHVARSERLRAAGQFLWSFVQTLHDTYAWPYARLFVLGFSQGACVAFDMLVGSVPPSVRLGGVVLIAGGLVAGPHTAAYAHRQSDAETPVLAITGGQDDVYPARLSAQTKQLFHRTFLKATARSLFTTLVVRAKGHEMIASADEMRALMAFFAQTLYLKNVALEQRSDIVEIVQ